MSEISQCKVRGRTTKAWHCTDCDWLKSGQFSRRARRSENVSEKRDLEQDLDTLASLYYVEFVMRSMPEAIRRALKAEAHVKELEVEAENACAPKGGLNVSKKWDRAEKDLAEAEWWEAEVVERLHDRAKKAGARVAELESEVERLRADRDLEKRWRKDSDDRATALENRCRELEAACAVLLDEVERWHNSEGVCNCRGDCLLNDTARTSAAIKLLARLEAAERVVEAMRELHEVAELRGDNVLPAPEDDPKPWSARIQSAWIEVSEALAVYEEANRGE